MESSVSPRREASFCSDTKRFYCSASADATVIPPPGPVAAAVITERTPDLSQPLLSSQTTVIAVPLAVDLSVPPPNIKIAPPLSHEEGNLAPRGDFSRPPPLPQGISLVELGTRFDPSTCPLKPKTLPQTEKGADSLAGLSLAAPPGPVVVSTSVGPTLQETLPGFDPTRPPPNIVQVSNFVL